MLAALRSRLGVAASACRWARSAWRASSSRCSGVFGLVLVVVVHQALGLGLEDAQRATAAAGELGELLGAEEQDRTTRMMSTRSCRAAPMMSGDIVGPHVG